jgi:hypothetical protein
MADENLYVAMMRQAINNSDGSQKDAFAEFEILILGQSECRLVWDLFEKVREPVLKRLHSQAEWLIRDGQPVAQNVGVTHRQFSHPVAPVDATGGSVVEKPQSRFRNKITKSRSGLPAHNVRPIKDAQSAGQIMKRIGERKSKLDSITDHFGQPLGSLTYFGLVRFANKSPIAREFAILAMDSGMPKDDMHPLREFMTPDEADSLWNRAESRVRQGIAMRPEIVL